MAMSWLSCRTCIASDPTVDTVKVNLDLANLPTLLDNENIKSMHLPDKTDFKLVQDVATGSPHYLNTIDESQNEQEQESNQADEDVLPVEACPEDMSSNRAGDHFTHSPQQNQICGSESESEESGNPHDHQAATTDVGTLGLDTHCSQEFSMGGAVREDEMAKQREEAIEESGHKQQQEEKRFARRKVNIWCRDHGFKDIYTPKKTLRGKSKFALHTAVKHENLEMVKMLLQCGAAKDVADSKGQTPLQAADRLKQGRVRDQIMLALRNA